ncbi:MAG: LacI family transcriptional regulator [Alicyclobacillus sp.]|nr:LacI family transcriptional regulator [Alicyclobacillus sp.]
MATNRDVARLAGVSPATVSRVLNDSGYVAPDVRDRVQRAIAELNYVPNRLARGLRKQRFAQIACVLPSIRNPFYHEILLGIQEAGLARGYTFSLFHRIAKKEEYLKVILGGFYDGIIFLSPFEVEKVYNIAEIGEVLPTVVYDDRGHPFSVPHVYVNLRETMYTNVTKLIEQGHRGILFLGYEFAVETDNPRYLGYMDAMREHGLKVLPEYLQFIADFDDTLSVGYKRMTTVLQQRIPFTAVAASNDLLAIGAMRALQQAGVRIPEDVSVVGVDDIEMARLVTPALSTARVPKRQIGTRLMELLLGTICGDEVTSSTIEVRTSYVERESTGPSATGTQLTQASHASAGVDAMDRTEKMRGA